MKRRPIVLAAGGTGGHVFPAEALASELLGRGRSLVLVTDVRGAHYGGALGTLPVYTVNAGTPTRGGIVTRLRGLVRMADGVLQARRMLGWLDPAAVVGFGGYAALPTMLAATWRRIPTILHEQNAILGRANRVLAPRVTSIALSFPATARLRPTDQPKAEIVGNPVRVEIRAVRASDYAAPAPDAPFNLLVTGGSQGAAIFSTLIPDALAGLPEPLRARLRVVQQCRPETLGTAQARYKSAGINAELAAFFTDMPKRLTAAHLVLCRAGASTVGEIAIAGRPALFIPFPHASDDHQSANAAAFAAGGAAWHFHQSDLTPEVLRQAIAELMMSPPELAARAAVARSLGRPDAARALATLVETIAAQHAPIQLVHSDRVRGNGGAAE